VQRGQRREQQGGEGGKDGFHCCSHLLKSVTALRLL
jgi:hypothetical protein